MAKGLHDQVLWNDIRQGSEQAFSELYFRYDDLLLSYGYTLIKDRELIKDSIQELFLDIWKRRNTSLVPEKVNRYLLKAFRRLLLRRINQDKKKLKEKETTGDITENPEEDHLIAQESENHQHKYLSQMISTLPNRQREIIYLKYYQGFTYEEIALIMGIQHEAAWNLLSRAIGKLREQAIDVKHILCLFLSFLWFFF